MHESRPPTLGGVTEPTTQIDQRNDIVKPVVAIALAAAGFLLFGGSYSRRTVNGVVVSESRLNLLGIALAIAAIVLAVKHIRMPGGNTTVRRALCGAAIVLAIVQILYSIGVF